MIAAAVSGAAAPAASIRIETPDDGRPHRVSARGLDAAALAALANAPAADQSRALAVYVGGRGPDPRMPAISGTYVADSEGLHFLPRFPLVSGVRYVARLAVGAARLDRSFEVEAPAVRERPRVAAVHPSGDALPENTLRLYVQFSRPMNPRGIARHVRLVGEDGRAVPLAFVEIEHGLWDPLHTRLTLFFHPGRTKRGVAPGERLGPPLRAGRHYRLVVDGTLTDGAGVPLGRDHEHRFRAVEADRASPRLADVTLEPPTSAHAPVVVALPEPLDQGLLHRWVWVEDAHGRPVAGHAVVRHGETRWQWHPAIPWTPGRFVVRLRSALEDRAGNTFDRLFDREKERGRESPGGSGEIIAVPFDVR